MATRWDTSLGGSGRDFPSTQWSLFLNRALPARERHPAMAALARTYWKPIYAYVRAKWARSNEDAKDHVQEFLIHLLNTDFLDRVDHRRGRFRDFIRGAIDRFMSKEERKRRAEKRGGTSRVTAIEGIGGDVALPDLKSKSPDEVMSTVWKREVLARAGALLRQAYREEKKDIYFTVFKSFYLAEGTRPDYATLAQRHDLSAADVSNYLMHAKKRFREILRWVVAETVQGPEELREEIEALFGREGP